MSAARLLGMSNDWYGAVAVTRSSPFGGKWRIVSSDTWDPEALDEFGPAHITFRFSRKRKG